MVAGLVAPRQTISGQGILWLTEYRQLFSTYMRFAETLITITITSKLWTSQGNPPICTALNPALVEGNVISVVFSFVSESIIKKSVSKLSNAVYYFVYKWHDIAEPLCSILTNDQYVTVLESSCFCKATRTERHSRTWCIDVIQ